MNELADFLLARIAEDEELAQEADRVWVHPGAYDSGFGARFDDEIASRYWDKIADPARVLAKCAADRGIVGECTDEENVTFSSRFAESVLQLLALPYADHPDYREEWKP